MQESVMMLCRLLTSKIWLSLAGCLSEGSMSLIMLCQPRRTPHVRHQSRLMLHCHCSFGMVEMPTAMLPATGPFYAAK